MLVGGTDFEITLAVPLVLEYEDVAKRMPEATSLSDDDVDRMERTVHMHQLYGFGKNDCMKLGLLNPSKPQGSEEYIHLPRRVALMCQVWPDESGGGFFSVAAGEHHSSRPSRDAPQCGNSAGARRAHAALIGILHAKKNGARGPACYLARNDQFVAKQ